MQRAEPIVLEITEDYVAVNKPPGMLTLPDRHDAELESLRGWMQKKFGQIWVIHRLDKDTSGLILFAKNEAAHKYYNGLFESREVTKIYKGIVAGKPLQSSGNIEVPIAEHPAKNGTMIVLKKGKPSLTDYVVEQTWNQFSLLRFDLHTGRTHQIRVHCKHLGHPIVVDPLYGDGKPVLLSAIKKKFKLSKTQEEERPILNRLGLHSFSLDFINRQGKPVHLEAPLPKDMEALMKQLDKHRAVGS
jgi:23S rRNA pseudouridine955/2504/2580 synthase/23S rRNA pseudouridine1911/1915/1917 synthase